jgi:hypothetical protein
VPEDIPLREIEWYLRVEARHLRMFPMRSEAVFGQLALAERFYVVNGIGLPPRGPLRALVADRFALLALLLVVLGLRAVWVAHRRGGLPAVPGAQP